MTTDTPKLARGIGPVGLLFSAIGAIIGSGWLFAGLYAAEAAGPAAIFSWVLAAVLLAIIAMPFAELGAALRAPGGCTRYAHAAFGGFASFIAGWLRGPAADPIRMGPEWLQRRLQTRAFMAATSSAFRLTPHAAQMASQRAHT